MPPDLLFYAALGGLFAHELDAVYRHEWRLLYGLRALPEEQARRLFIGLHAPLFAVLIALVAHPDSGMRGATMQALDAFCVIHAGLHARLSGHARYAFRGAVSNLLIYGPAVLGALHLAWTVQP